MGPHSEKGSSYEAVLEDWGCLSRGAKAWRDHCAFIACNPRHAAVTWSVMIQGQLANNISYRQPSISRGSAPVDSNKHGSTIYF